MKNKCPCELGIQGRRYRSLLEKLDKVEIERDAWKLEAERLKKELRRFKND